MMVVGHDYIMVGAAERQESWFPPKPPAGPPATNQDNLHPAQECPAATPLTGRRID
jgi:hypothetical protein